MFTVSLPVFSVHTHLPPPPPPPPPPITLCSCHFTLLYSNFQPTAFLKPAEKQVTTPLYSNPTSLPLSQNGPRLLDADKNVLASGREDIAKYITNENNSVRSSEKKKVRL